MQETRRQPPIASSNLRTTRVRRRIFVRGILSGVALLVSLYAFAGMAMSADLYVSSRQRQFEVGVVAWAVVMVLSLIAAIVLAVATWRAARPRVV